jgi:glycosyltransferase involved in cell wall biosynthesis
MMTRPNDNPEISVVICTRNRCTFLAEAVASVRAQTGVKYEILIVDDASTDDTPALIKALCSTDIRCIRLQQPMERSVARNQGLAAARGDFIMFLDDDDVLWPGALAILKKALMEHPVAVAAVGARQDWFVDENYRRRDTHPRFPRCRRIFHELLFGWSAVSGQNLFRTNMIRRLGGYDSSVIPCEDRDLWLRVAFLGPVVLRPEIVMTYRFHTGQRRPVDIRRLREYVARRAIRTLPRAARRHGLILRCCTALVEQAEVSMQARHYAAGIGYALRAPFLAPGLFASPLIGPWICRRLAGRIWHSLAHGAGKN